MVQRLVPWARNARPTSIRHTTAIVAVCIAMSAPQPASAQNLIFDFLKEIFDAKRSQGFSEQQLEILRPAPAQTVDEDALQTVQQPSEASEPVEETTEEGEEDHVVSPQLPVTETYVADDLPESDTVVPPFDGSTGEGEAVTDDSLQTPDAQIEPTEEPVVVEDAGEPTISDEEPETPETATSAPVSDATAETAEPDANAVEAIPDTSDSNSPTQNDPSPDSDQTVNAEDGLSDVEDVSSVPE
jgi:hypothetical protein